MSANLSDEKKFNKKDNKENPLMQIINSSEDYNESNFNENKNSISGMGYSSNQGEGLFGSINNSQGNGFFENNNNNNESHSLFGNSDNRTNGNSDNNQGKSLFINNVNNNINQGRGLFENISNNKGNSEYINNNSSNMDQGLFRNTIKNNNKRRGLLEGNQKEDNQGSALFENCSNNKGESLFGNSNSNRGDKGLFNFNINYNNKNNSIFTNNNKSKSLFGNSPVSTHYFSNININNSTNVFDSLFSKNKIQILLKGSCYSGIIIINPKEMDFWAIIIIIRQKVNFLVMTRGLKVQIKIIITVIIIVHLINLIIIKKILYLKVKK